MTGKPDDAALMLRYADGDAAAFDALYRRHNDALYRYLLRLTGNRDAAADLFQDVWAKVINARHRYRPTAGFRTWLYRIAHNAFIDQLRRNRRYGDGPPLDPDLRPDPGALPDTQVEHALARERLLVALQSLPTEQRDAFLLHEEAGLTIDQIANVTGVARETAKSRLRYAMNKLKQAMAAAAHSAEPAA